MTRNILVILCNCFTFSQKTSNRPKWNEFSQQFRKKYMSKRSLQFQYFRNISQKLTFWSRVRDDLSDCLMNIHTIYS